MPLELIATAPRTPELRSCEEPPLGADEVRLRSTFSAVKHGTQLSYAPTAPTRATFPSRSTPAVVGATRPR